MQVLGEVRPPSEQQVSTEFEEEEEEEAGVEVVQVESAEHHQASHTDRLQSWLLDTAIR